jgi:hypothetical protein
MVHLFVEFTLGDNSTKCKSKLDVELMSVPSGMLVLETGYIVSRQVCLFLL